MHACKQHEQVVKGYWCLLFCFFVSPFPFPGQCILHSRLNSLAPRHTNCSCDFTCRAVASTQQEIRASVYDRPFLYRPTTPNSHKKKTLTWSPRSAIKMRSTDSTYLSCTICGMQAARRCWELGGKITKPLVRTLFRGIGHCFDQTNWFVTASVVFKKGYHVNCSFYRLQDLVIIILIQESLR